MREVKILCPYPCELGEGPLWHPLRKELLWFDINQSALLTTEAIEAINPEDPNCFEKWSFDSPVSAAGIIDREKILLAKSEGLYSFNLETKDLYLLTKLEADIEENRTNDSRTAIDGSFWVSTMSYRNEVGRTGSGSIYRYRSGTLIKILSGLSIPNSICFDEVDGKVRCYWSDSKDRRIYYLEVEDISKLEKIDRSRVKVFCETQKGVPDGSVIDSEHRLWNAEWGAGKVVAYTPKGKVDDEIILPVTQPTCPAFCGERLDQLVVTSALMNLSEEEKQEQPLAGMTFIVSMEISGKPEVVVCL